MATAIIGIDVQNRTGGQFFDSVLVSEYDVRYKVSSADTDDQADVLATSGLPAIWDAFPNDATALCLRRSPSVADGTRKLWYVDVHYTSKLPTGSGQNPSGGPGGLPEDFAPSLTWSGETELVEATHDVVTGVPIQMGNGMPYNPPLMRRQKISVVTWSRWQRAFGGAAEIDAWQGYINTQQWDGWKPESVLIDRIEARTEIVNGLLYFYVTDVLKYRSDTWRARPPQKSTHELKAGELSAYPTVAGSSAFGWISSAGVATPNSPSFGDYNLFKPKNFSARYPGT